MINKLVVTIYASILMCLMWGQQALALTPSQIDALMNMSPNQQQQLVNMAQQRNALANKRINSQVQQKENVNTVNLTPGAKSTLDLEPETPVLKPGDSVIISFVVKKPEKNKLSKPVIAPLYVPKLEKNLFTLDRKGFVAIQSIGRIELAGLSELQAAARIGIEPFLQGYDIEVMLLPFKQSDVNALKPYGYDIFRQNAGVLQPESYIPVPDNYVVGPGDQVHIQLVGKDNTEYLLEVSRNSTLSIPGIGNLPVTGLTFNELKRDLKKRIKRQLIGVEAFITMGELRSMQIFIMGEVEQPGAYSVDALATMTHALTYGGGINTIGSLRHISLKRKGKVVGILDLYELLNDGSTARDLRLKPGDVVHVPPKKTIVSILGEIARPAVYELKKEKDLTDIVELAGGLLAKSDLSRVQIGRVVNNENKLYEVDYSTELGRKFAIKNGDIITFNSVLERQQNVVYLSGEIVSPGKYAWTPQMKITDVIADLRILKPGADPEYVVIKRYDSKGYNISVLSTSILQAILHPEQKQNISLQPLDEIIVLSLDENRTLQLKPVLDQLLVQTESGNPAPIVKVSGQVKGPGKYPLKTGMRVSDLIVASGRLLESAFTLEAELTRFKSEAGSPRDIVHIPIDLAGVIRGDATANILLQAHDLLNIKEIPLWQEDEVVQLFGEVRFPGKYAIRRGESLFQLLQRAGGLTQFSYPQGAVFTREDLKKREQERLDTMARNLETELATIALQRSGDPTQITDVGAASGLLSQLKGTQAAGRLVIDLEHIAAGDQKQKPVILRDGDILYVPSIMQEVSVIGQVFHATSHLHKKDLTLDHYIKLSGGMTRKADRDNIYVIRANGGVQAAPTRWMDEDVEIFPGDTVIVPLDAEKVSKLKLWTSISQIVYQLGLSAAAWNTVGLFR